MSRGGIYKNSALLKILRFAVKNFIKLADGGEDYWRQLPATQFKGSLYTKEPLKDANVQLAESGEGYWRHRTVYLAILRDK